MWAAEGLAETCWVVSVDQETGLGPDEVAFGRWGSSREKGKDGECEKPVAVVASFLFAF